MHCPSYTTLSPQTEEERAILAQAEVHSWTCPACAAFLDYLHELEPALAEPDFEWSATTPCPAAAELASWTERAPPEEGLVHLAACADCRADLLLAMHPNPFLELRAAKREETRPETPSQRLRLAQRRTRSGRLRKVIPLRDHSAHAPFTAVGAAAALLLISVLLASGGDPAPRPVAAGPKATSSSASIAAPRAKRPTPPATLAKTTQVTRPESVASRATVVAPPAPELVPLELSDDGWETVGPEPTLEEELLAASSRDDVSSVPAAVDADPPAAGSETEQPIAILASAGVEIKSKDRWAALETETPVRRGQLLRASKRGASLALAQGGRIALAQSAVLVASAPMHLLKGELLVQGQGLLLNTPAGRLEVSGEVHMRARRGRIQARLLRGVATLAHRSRRLLLRPMQEVTAGKFAIVAVRRLPRMLQPGWLAKVPTVAGSALELTPRPRDDDDEPPRGITSGEGAHGASGDAVPPKASDDTSPPPSAQPPCSGERESRHARGRSGGRGSATRGPNPPAGANGGHRGGSSRGQSGPPRGNGRAGGHPGGHQNSRGSGHGGGRHGGGHSGHHRGGRR